MASSEPTRLGKHLDEPEPSAGQASQRELVSAGKPLSPLLVPAEVAGSMCGRSEASWWRDHAAGRIPAPVKLGGRTLWRVEELRRWVEGGCPSRAIWEMMEKARRR
jgi:predicted DNA-binding transcriptional regulator AlpA